MLAVLCVGETEAERDAGETEAVLRRQLDADLAAVEDADLGRLVVAYEPIWAIGTGRTATPEQAEETIAFIRELLAARDPEAAAAVRILYGGSVKPGQRRRALRAAIDRRRPGRRRVARPGRLRRDLRGREAMIPDGAGSIPVPSLCLVILDGWGLAEPGPGQRRLAGRDAGVRRALGALSAHDPLGQRPRRRPARRPDGQLGGRPPQPRRRRRRQAGPGPHRRRRRRRLAVRERGPARRLRGRPREPARSPAPDGPGLRRRRPLGLDARRGADRARRAGGRSRRRRARVHRRARHAADLGAVLHLRARALAAPRGPRRHRQRPLLRDGPRPALGADEARLRRDRPRRRVSAPTAPRKRSPPPTSGARRTSSSARP